MTYIVNIIQGLIEGITADGVAFRHFSSFKEWTNACARRYLLLNQIK